MERLHSHRLLRGIVLNLRRFSLRADEILVIVCTQATKDSAESTVRNYPQNVKNTQELVESTKKKKEEKTKGTVFVGKYPLRYL